MKSIFLMRPRSLFWFIKASAKRYNMFLFAGFLTGLFLFVATTIISPLVRGYLKGPDIKRIGMIGSYTPTNFPLEIQNRISYGLTNITASGEATPAAAQNWEIKDEGKTYIFHLNKDLTWQDGKQFRAGDINYNLKDAEISILGDYDIEIKLKEAFAPLPVLLSQPLFKEGLVGLGNYAVTSLKVDNDHLTDIYLRPLKDKEKLPLLKYRFYPTGEEAILAYKLGEIDIVENISDLSPLTNWRVKVETKTLNNRHIVLFYNMNDPLLSQKGIRQGLDYALPDFIREERASSPLSALSWAYNDKSKTYANDPKLAKKLLQSNEDSSKSAQKQIALFTNSTYQDLAKVIASSWRDLGFDVEIKIEKDLPENYQILLAAQEIPADPDQYGLWHSTQDKTNITNYRSPRIDKLLEDGRKIIDQNERRKKYFDFQKYLMDDLPAVFLYYPKVYTVSRR